MSELLEAALPRLLRLFAYATQAIQSAWSRRTAKKKNPPKRLSRSSVNY